MRINSARDFRDQATGLLRSKDPVLVTRRGRMAGVFFPTPGVTLPIELKRELFPILTTEIRRQLRRRRLSERDVDAAFDSWRKTRRAARRRANVLLSAVTGGRAGLILARPDLAEIVTTASVMGEIQEYAGPLVRKVGLPTQAFRTRALV